MPLPAKGRHENFRPAGKGSIMRRKGIASILLAAGILAVGCNYTTPTGPPTEMTAAQKDYEAIWQASRSVLHDYYFTLDRQDRRAGIITTLPLVGKQFFEFWRKDAVTNTDLLEDTVQTMYRTATVTITELPDRSGAYQVTVQVAVARSDKPGQPAHVWVPSPLEDEVGDGTAPEVIPPKGATSQPATKPAKVNLYRVSLGRDSLLERKLAQEITAASIHSMGGNARVEAALAPGEPASEPATQPTTQP